MEKPLTVNNVNVGIVGIMVHGIPKITWLIATLVVLWSAPIVWSMAMKANTVPIGAKKKENPKMIEGKNLYYPVSAHEEIWGHEAPPR